MRGLVSIPNPAPARGLLAKAATAIVYGQVNKTGTGHVADEQVRLLLRAATAPATLDNSAWASSLAKRATPDFVGTLGPLSAASSLIALSLALEYQAGQPGVPVPGVITDTTLGKFVAAGGRIPVVQFAIDGPVLEHKKVAFAVAMTREAAMSTNLPTIMEKTVLPEAAALALDPIFFGDDAGDATLPAGIRYQVDPIDETASGGIDAMLTDLSNLAGAVAGIGSEIVFVASPVQAAKINLLAPQPMTYRVLSSAGLPDGTVMAIAVRALVFALDGIPRIESSTEAVLHLDTAPEAIGSAGSPNVVAAPTKSMWQHDMIAMRIILDIDWALRAPGAVAWVENVSW